MAKRIPESEIDRDLSALEPKWNSLVGFSFLTLVALITGYFIADAAGMTFGSTAVEAAKAIGIISFLAMFYFSSKQSKAEEHRLRLLYNDLIDIDEKEELKSKLENSEDRYFSNKENENLVKDIKNGAKIKDGKFEDLKENFLNRLKDHEIGYDFDEKIDSYLEKENEEQEGESYRRALFYDLLKRTESADLETRDLAVLSGAVLLIPAVYLTAEYYKISQVYRLATIAIGLIPIYYTMKMYRANQ